MIVVHPSTLANYPLSYLIQNYANMGYVLWSHQIPNGDRILCLRPHVKQSFVESWLKPKRMLPDTRRGLNPYDPSDIPTLGTTKPSQGIDSLNISGIDSKKKD